MKELIGRCIDCIYCYEKSESDNFCIIYPEWVRIYNINNHVCGQLAQIKKVKK